MRPRIALSRFLDDTIFETKLGDLGILLSFSGIDPDCLPTLRPIPPRRDGYATEAARALSSDPDALDLFTWLSYRCLKAKGEERIRIFGDFGLVHQIGSAGVRSTAQIPRALGSLVGLGESSVA